MILVTCFSDNNRKWSNASLLIEPINLSVNAFIFGAATEVAVAWISYKPKSSVTDWDPLSFVRSRRSAIAKTVLLSGFWCPSSASADGAWRSHSLSSAEVEHILYPFVLWTLHEKVFEVDPEGRYTCFHYLKRGGRKRSRFGSILLLAHWYDKKLHHGIKKIYEL